MLGLDVVVLVLWALNRDIAYLLRAVDIDNLGPPGLAGFPTKLGRNDLSRCDDLRYIDRDRVFHAGFDQRSQIARIRIQIIGHLTRDPFGLLLYAGAQDIKPDRRSRSERKCCAVTPPIGGRSVWVASGIRLVPPNKRE